MELTIRLAFLSSMLATTSGLQIGNIGATVKPRAAPLRMADDKITQGKVHGEGGVYVGGYWKTLEECKSEFNIAGGSGENMPGKGEACPRSMTRHSAACTSDAIACPSPQTYTCPPSLKRSAATRAPSASIRSCT